MIVAREWRVEPRAVAAWTYTDFYHALQLLTEERLGKAVRSQQRADDAKWNQAHQALKR